jgi:hypothetical protein
MQGLQISILHIKYVLFFLQLYLKHSGSDKSFASYTQDVGSNVRRSLSKMSIIIIHF